jgi:hypothetical protein
MFQDLSVAIRVTDEKSPRFAESMTHGTFIDQAARFMPKPYWEGTWEGPSYEVADVAARAGLARHSRLMERMNRYAHHPSASIGSWLKRRTRCSSASITSMTAAIGPEPHPGPVGFRC